MRAAIYCRVSSSAQRKRDTIASQKRILPEFVKRQGWQLVATYIDDGKSARAGKLDKRDGFNRLLADAKAGLFDVVCVVDFDRLTRSDDWEERGRILGTFQRAGILIAMQSTGEVIDWAQKGLGVAIQVSLKADLAAEESRIKSERSIRGRIEAIKKGRKGGGFPPYGYDYDKISGKYSINNVEAEIVKEVFDRLAKGESLNALACDFNERGIPRRRGGRWTHHMVWAICTNRAYVGEWEADKTRKLVVSLPRLVSDEKFRKANECRKLYRKYTENRNRYVNLIEGIARCGICGDRIVITGSEERGRKYVCRSNKRNKGKSKCSLPPQSVKEVDERVWRSICRFAEDPDIIYRATSDSSIKEESKDWEADLADWRRRLDQLEKRHSYIFNLFQRGKISQRDLDAAVESASRDRSFYERNIEVAKRAIESARHSQNAANSIKRLIEKTHKMSKSGITQTLIKKAPPNRRRELVRLFVPGRSGYYVSLGEEKIHINGCIQLTNSPSRTSKLDAGPGAYSFRLVA